MEEALESLEHLCYPAFGSLDNALYQNPCQVAHVLFGVCDAPTISRDDYSLSKLDLDKGQRHYPAPNQWQATECICSMAGYNLVQACAACQQTTAISSTSWNDWVSNCTMSNINFGKTFPYEIPDTTTLPDWAYANNGHGSFDMGDTFRRINSNASSWPFNPSSFSIVTGTSTSTAASSSSTSESTGYGEANEGPPSTATNGEQAEEHNTTTRLAVGIAIPLIVIGGLAMVAWLYVRRKKRNARQRGFRLGSNHHLPPPSFLVDPSVDPFSDIAHSHPVMTQQKDSRGITSLFLPSETVFTRSSHSRSSFTTNSVSTGSISAAPFSHRSSMSRQARLGPDPYGPRDSTSLFAPSTTDYDSRSSSAGYTYDDDGEDESISPFSDIHRPRPTVLATRNNLHNTSGSRYSYAASEMSHSESDSMLSGRSGIDPDVESLITLSSRVSKLSRTAPSSSGATYGGAHDDDDDEDGDFEGSEGGFETEAGEGNETEQGEFETETEREEEDDDFDDDDAISLNTTTSTNHRP